MIYIQRRAFFQGDRDHDHQLHNRKGPGTDPRGRRAPGRKISHRRTERLARHAPPDGDLPRQGLGAHLRPPGDAHASHRHQGPGGDHHL